MTIKQLAALLSQLQNGRGRWDDRYLQKRTRAILRAWVRDLVGPKEDISLPETLDLKQMLDHRAMVGINVMRSEVLKKAGMREK